MKVRYLFLLLAFCFNTGWADFSDALFRLHPIQPKEAEPYLIEITGEWPDDCHPGEQKPVIRDYTGDTALIEFETIVEHVTCNDVPTPYRVLVDMSDVIDSVTGSFVEIEVTLRIGETEFTKSLDLICICSPVPVGPHINPEAGLYFSDGLKKQGLPLARQNQRMGAFPLIYDESGSSEWLIGAGGIVEDVFFAELLESTGGQCLGCLPPDEPPQMGVVGKISMLMDSEGVIQVKINDGLFTTYKPSMYGYWDLDISGFLRTSSPDLSGRWAFVDVDHHTGLPEPGLSSFVLPLVFDIALESVGPEPEDPVPPIVCCLPPPPISARFSIRNIDGENIAEMVCGFVENNWILNEMICHLDSPDLEDGDSPYRVELLSIERIKMTYTGAILGVGSSSSGTAVRID